MENTAKNFVLQLGSLITLYISLGALLTLLFGVINITFPDAVDTYWRIEHATESIRISLAMLIVFFPTYLVLTRLVQKVRRNESGTYLGLTKWLIYLSLLVGGLVILGDLVAVIHTFLSGELAARFCLKAFALLVVIGSAFTYYALDARGYWQDNEKKSITYAVCVTIVVLAVIVVGFAHSETPSEVRERNIDQNQISSLQNIQWQVENYYRTNEMLPETLAEAYNGLEVPKAPDGRVEYTYNITDSGFELCAEFAHDSQESIARPYFDEGMVIKNAHDWSHQTGKWCFERVISE